MPQAPRAACTRRVCAPALPSCRNGAGDKSAAFPTLSSHVSLRKRGMAGKKWAILWLQIARARVGHFRFAPQAEGGRERQTSKLSFSISRLTLGPTIESIPHPNPQRCLAHPKSGMRGAASLLPAKGSRVRSSTPARSVRSENLQPCGDPQPVAPKCDTFSKSPLPVVPHRIVPDVPGDFVLNPVPLLSPRLRRLLGTSPRTPLGVRGVNHLESCTRSACLLPIPRAQGKVSGLPEKVFSPERLERPGWLSPPRSPQLSLLGSLPALPSVGSGPASSPLSTESTNDAAAELPEPGW